MANFALSREFNRLVVRAKAIGAALVRPLVPAFLVALVKKMSRDDVSVLAASIAYYGFLSVFPLALALIALSGMLLPSEHIQTQILDFFAQYFPGSGDFLQQNIADIIRYRGALGAIGLIGLIWSSTSIFSAVSLGVNRAWGVEHQHPLYIKKPREIAMVLATGILLLLSLGLSALFSFLDRNSLSFSGVPYTVATIATAYFFSLLVFSLVFNFLPVKRPGWAGVWPGAILSAFLFELGKYLFVQYLDHFGNYTRIYGSVASVIVMLLWTYFSAYILLLGAEFNAVLRRYRRGESQPPSGVPSGQ
jgi:membrane protein